MDKWLFKECPFCGSVDIIGSKEEEAVALETWNRRFEHVCINYAR